MCAYCMVAIVPCAFFYLVCTQVDEPLGGLLRGVCVVLGIIFFIAGIIAYRYEKAEREIEEKNRRVWGENLSQEEINRRKVDPQYRNPERGRGPKKGYLDPNSCYICGAYVNRYVMANTSNLCDDCAERWEEALKNNMIPHIPGYTDDKKYGKTNTNDLWTKQQIAALDCMDGVITEEMAREEIAAAMEEGRKWAQNRRRELECMKLVEQRTQADRKKKATLNDEAQRLLR